ncbi:MAG: thioesterase family protein, partial [Comamonas sp.]
MPDPQTCERFDTGNSMEWLKRYDMRVVQGAIPKVWDDSTHETLSQLWVRDDPARALDFPALAALS